MSRYSERQAAKFAQEERIAKAQQYINQLESEQTVVPSPKIPVPAERSVETAQTEIKETGFSSLTQLLVVADKKPANRGIHSGGKSRYYADWFELLARLMADGTFLKKAAAQLGLHFTAKERDRLLTLKEFQRLYRAYRRLYHSEVWGQPKEPEVLERLLKHEDARYRQQICKPRGAKYVSHPRKV